MLPLWTSVEYIEARIDVVDSGQRSSDQSALLGVRGQQFESLGPWHANKVSQISHADQLVLGVSERHIHATIVRQELPVRSGSEQRKL